MTYAQRIEEIKSRYGVNTVYANGLVARHKHFQSEKDFWNQVDNVMTPRPKPFVKWVGGKRQLLQQFRDMSLFPPRDFDSNKHKYFEPFVGGGAVFFETLSHKAFLSDVNDELVRTYNVIKDDVDNLIASLKTHKHDKEYYYQIREIDPNTISDVEVASRFIFLNRAGFNGLYRVNRSGKFNVPFGDNKNPLICDEVNLRKVSRALEGVQINKEDYKTVLKRAKKGDFVYFDPPYHPVSKTSAFTSYTSTGFGEKEQIELRDTFMELHRRGCFVMLSNSDTPFINKIYSEIEDKDITIHKVKAGRAINSKGSGRGKVSEVLVVNY